MMTLIFDGILLLPKQNISIFDIEKYLTRMKLRVTLHRVSCSYINVVTIIRGLT